MRSARRTFEECGFAVEIGMNSSERELRERAKRYAESRAIQVILEGKLGNGTDGFVWTTSRKTALKAFERPRPYDSERDAYFRLSQHGITRTGRFSVPQLIDLDNDLLIVEMSVVSQPFILDFGKVYIDQPPDYEPGHWEESLEASAELFGRDQWPEVEEALGTLQNLGIYYVDVKPKNIDFGE